MKTQIRAEDFYFFDQDRMDRVKLGDLITIQFDFKKKEAAYEWRRKTGELVEREEGKDCFRWTIEVLMELTIDGLVWFLPPDIVVYYDDGWMIEIAGKNHHSDIMSEVIDKIKLAG